CIHIGFPEAPLEMLYLLLHNIGALFLMIGEDTTAKKVSPVFSFSRISLDLFWAVNPILQNKSVITAFLVIVESWTQCTPIQR
ncbi:MAG: hypothetical protein PHQ41_07490, partial [Candidatus Cloacimonetes bacterium]|uniref:hypothetical protein n=1 Tax=Sphaerochaeta sp. TaxID=1972642 RepID=UPI0029744E0D